MSAEVFQVALYSFLGFTLTSDASLQVGFAWKGVDGVVLYLDVCLGDLFTFIVHCTTIVFMYCLSL